MSFWTELIYVPFAIFFSMVSTCAICGAGLGIYWAYEWVRNKWRERQ